MQPANLLPPTQRRRSHLQTTHRHRRAATAAAAWLLAACCCMLRCSSTLAAVTVGGSGAGLYFSRERCGETPACGVRRACMASPPVVASLLCEPAAVVPWMVCGLLCCLLAADATYWGWIGTRRRCPLKRSPVRHTHTHTHTHQRQRDTTRLGAHRPGTRWRSCTAGFWRASFLIPSFLPFLSLFLPAFASIPFCLRGVLNRIQFSPHFDSFSTSATRLDAQNQLFLSPSKQDICLCNFNRMKLSKRLVYSSKDELSTTLDARKPTERRFGVHQSAAQKRRFEHPQSIIDEQ